MRGENDIVVSKSASFIGSSPHARGKPPELLTSMPIEGLIPACAGKTHKQRLACPDGWAHPRMRGENVVQVLCDTSELGSSPHARGKQLTKGFLLCTNRLIPACAGKTPVQ